MELACSQTQTHADPIKKTLFLIEKYVDDVKQHEKLVPELLEPTMRPTCLEKEELRPILFKNEPS